MLSFGTLNITSFANLPAAVCRDLDAPTKTGIQNWHNSECIFPSCENWVGAAKSPSGLVPWMPSAVVTLATKLLTFLSHIPEKSQFQNRTGAKQSKAKQSASRWMIENRTTSLPPRVQDFDRLLSLLSCVASDRRTLHTRDFTQMVTHLTIWCRGVCDPFLALIGVFAVCFSNCINWMMPLIPSTIFTNELPRRLGQKRIRNLKLHQQE